MKKTIIATSIFSLSLISGAALASMDNNRDLLYGDVTTGSSQSTEHNPVSQVPQGIEYDVMYDNRLTLNPSESQDSDWNSNMDDKRDQLYSAS